MKLWRLAGLSFLVGLLLFAAQKYHARTLSGERAKTTQAVDDAKTALKRAEAAEIAALDAELRAKAAESRRAAQAPHRAAIVAAAPDTCAPAIDALQGELADADSTIAGLSDALEEQKRATATLKPATKAVVDAAEDLVAITGGSFLQDLIPEVGFGITAGVSPLTRRADVVVGVGLNWDF
jgi:multidrug efflux pump subunit AcrA (membrane-fusion protein)